jgi:cell wall-associated NlpC family hydrolase
MSTAGHRAPKLITPRKATAVAVVGLSAGTVALVPSSSQAETLAQAKAQYQSDLSQSEAAGQTYDAEEQAYAQLQQKIDALQGEISQQNQQISTLDATIGLQAAQQYRNGGVSSTLELTLSASPTTYLDKVASQNEIASQEAKQLKTIATDQAELKQEQALAATLVQQQQAALTKAKAAKQQADNLTAAAKELVASLTPAQQEQVSIGSTGSMWFHYSGTLPVATGRAATAVAYAESKLGDDYVYAANGPNEFDCSGLTQEAWKAAGISIPRDSYDQYAQLPHVSEADLQPGDLLFFFPTSAGPSHVAIYVGNGMYIQATHPGSYVEWASLNPSSPYYGNMPYVGAARPD